MSDLVLVKDKRSSSEKNISREIGEKANEIYTKQSYLQKLKPPKDEQLKKELERDKKALKMLKVGLRLQNTKNSKKRDAGEIGKLEAELGELEKDFAVLNSEKPTPEKSPAT